MKKQLITLLAAVAILSLGASANAVVLNFDDYVFPSDAAINDLDSNYGEFKWSDDAYLIFKDKYPDTGYQYGVKSGEYALYNAYSSDISIWKEGSTFEFNGAYFTASHMNEYDIYYNEITINAFRNGTDAGSQLVTVTGITPLFVNFDFGQIDKLTFHSSNNQFVMDDFTYDKQVNPPVPEPSSLILGLLSIGSFLGLKRKKSA